jgi:hypothetical protein
VSDAVSPIDYAELLERLADPDYDEKRLIPYLRAERVEGSTTPRLGVTDAVVLPAGEEATTQASLGLGFLNAVFRARRRRRFERRLRDDPQLPVLVAEGDSWFEYPVWLEDVIDLLSAQKYNVACLSGAGHELVDMVADGEYAERLRDLIDDGVAVKGFLLSGGGNDIVGDELKQFIKPFETGRPAGWYLETPAFEAKMQELAQGYRTIVTTLGAIDANLPIFVHGYDYGNPLPDQGFQIPPKDGWLAEPMREQGIHGKPLQKAIVKRMIDRFHDELVQLVAAFPTVHQIDNRGVVGTLWNDELHPDDVGFGKVGEKFFAALTAAGI